MASADKVSDDLKREQQEVESEIRRAFRGVTRLGGVSWSESVVIDGDGSGRTPEQARATDIEARWEDLVDDPKWMHEPGMGGFCFLDPVGFRYYLAPAMIRCTRELVGETVALMLTNDFAFIRDQLNLLDTDPSKDVAKFVRFMIRAHHMVGGPFGGSTWERAYASYWNELDRGSST